MGSLAYIGACATLNAYRGPLTASLRTDSAEIGVRYRPPAYVARIGYVFTNTTEGPVSKAGCGRPPDPHLEKKVNGSWVPVYYPAYLACLTKPDFHIESGASHYDVIDFIAYERGHNIGPELLVDSIDGIYRLQWWFSQGTDATAKGIRRVRAVSNEFRMVLRSDRTTLPESSAEPAAAQIFSGGIISDDNEQWRLTFTPDGRTAYFAESAQFFPFTRQATIYFSEYVNGSWTTPVVAPFSGKYSDIDPFIAPDGQRLYFSSIRPVDGVARQDIDIWMVERTPTGWSEPVRLGPEVNSPADELYPSVAADGTLYFASGPPAPQAGRHWDIYSSRRVARGLAPRQALGSGVNTSPTASDPHPQAAWEFNPEISVDGKTLVFTSLRPGGFGLGDLYVSHMKNGEWSAAKNLGPLVNTAADEYHPTLSRNRRELYFVRRAAPVKGNFYRISTQELKALER